MNEEEEKKICCWRYNIRQEENDISTFYPLLWWGKKNDNAQNIIKNKQMKNVYIFVQQAQEVPCININKRTPIHSKPDLWQVKTLQCSANGLDAHAHNYDIVGYFLMFTNLKGAPILSLLLAWMRYRKVLRFQFRKWVIFFVQSKAWLIAVCAPLRNLNIFVFLVWWFVIAFLSKYIWIEEIFFFWFRSTGRMELGSCPILLFSNRSTVTLTCIPFTNHVHWNSCYSFTSSDIFNADLVVFFSSSFIETDNCVVYRFDSGPVCLCSNHMICVHVT